MTDDTSNSAKMTLEERVAQKIKNSELGQFFNEDDLGDVVKRAINEAFFKPRHVEGRNSYDRKELPPLAVELATGVFREKMAELVKPVLDEMFASAEFREAAQKVIASTIPNIAQRAFENGVQSALSDFSYNNNEWLKQLIANAMRQ